MSFDAELTGDPTTAERNAEPLRTGVAHVPVDPFAGPGPTATALRRVDWAATPLGPVERWPVGLLCSAYTVTRAPAPMLLWWGPDFHQIHNDAVLAAVGGGEPSVGGPAKSCWPDHWGAFERAARVVLERGETLQLDDVTLPVADGPVIWSVTLGPLLDDAGRVGGVLAAGLDVTARVRERDLERQDADAIAANLQLALATNRRIGTAIGILMAERRITDAAAFDLLRQASQRAHRKLRAIAEEVVLTGVLPDGR